jgi:methyl-accepting chemotaxis protein
MLKRAGVIGILPLLAYSLLIFMIGLLTILFIFLPDNNRQLLEIFCILLFAYAIVISVYFAWIVTGALGRLISVVENLTDGDDTNDAETFTVLKPLAERKDGIGRIASLFILFIQTSIEKRHWFATILDYIPVSIAVADINSNLTLVNRSMEDMLHMDRTRILGQSILHQHGKLFKILERGTSDLKSDQGKTIFNQDGQYFQLDSAPLLDTSGKRTGLIEVIQDVSSTSTALEYQKTAVATLSNDLEKMARGIYDFELTALAEGSQHTQVIHQELLEIQQNIENVRRMTGSLLRTVVADTEDVLSASENLSHAANQAGMATAQIAATIQDVARGASDTSGSVMKTAQTVQKMNTELAGVATGVENQAKAVRQALLITEKIAGADGIAAKVSISAQGVERLLGESEKINGILETINEFASQTNLLAINAAIETAHVDTQSTTLTETILNRQMVIQARLLDQILCISGRDLPQEFWNTLAKRAGIDTICITDQAGVIVYSNDPAIVGWKFPDDPKSQAFEFRKLIGQKDGVVCQKPQKRSADNRTFKFVGVSRSDEPGIVQVAFDADSLAAFKMRLGGFAVVAEEVRKLASKSADASKEIGGVVMTMQTHIAGSVKLTGEVSNEIKAAALELKNAIGVVSQAVDQNQKATATMTSNTNEIMTMVENIAAVSEENSAATEQVSAATEEMTAQVEEVGASAQTLQATAKELKSALAKFRV